jgi:hypothetical protein
MVGGRVLNIARKRWAESFKTRKRVDKIWKCKRMNSNGNLCNVDMCLKINCT